MSHEERNYTGTEAGEAPENARQETEPDTGPSRDQAEPFEAGSGVEPLPLSHLEGTEEEGAVRGEQLQPEVADRALGTRSDAQPAEAPDVTMPAPESPAEIQVQIGQLVQEIYGEKRSFLSPLSTGEIRRIKEVFVPSPEFKEWRKRRADGRRIYMVCGREHAGKLTTGVSVALERTGGVPEHLTFLRFRRPEATSPSLDAFLWSDEPEKRTRKEKRETVYLAEDCFADRLIELSALSRSLEELERRLVELRAYLILSTEPKPGLQDLRIEQISAEGVDLALVFENHLSRYQSGSEAVKIHSEVAEAARSFWKQQRDHPLFRFPVQVRGFCHKLGELGYLANSKEIAQVADEAARIGQLRGRTWFQELNPNQRLFALLTSLFRGLEQRYLDLIYAEAVRYLRDSGIAGLEDPRQEGRDDLLEVIHARVEVAAMPQVRGPIFQTSQTHDEHSEDSEGAPEGESRPGNAVEPADDRLQQVVVFTDRTLEDEVRRQVRNHSALLWSLRPLFLELAERRQDLDSWRFRKAIGVAIGQLGAAYQGEMIELLQQLAVGRSAEVVAVAGAALGQSFASDSGFQAAGLHLLKDWIQDRRPALTWVAGLAVWRAYYGILEAATSPAAVPDGVREVLDKLLQLLEKIVRSSGRWGGGWAKRNRDSVIYALRMIARADLPSVIRLIDRWLQEKSSGPLSEVAAAAALEIFQEVRERKPRLDTIQQLQRLILPLFSLELSPAGLGIVLGTLRGWQRWSDVGNGSFADLLQIANRCRGKTAQRFSFGIVKFWLEAPGASEATRRHGQALLARIFAMDGSPVGVPGRERGLILIDAASPAEAGELAEAGRRVHWLLQSLIDTEIRPLGGTSVLVGSGETTTHRGLLAASRPRLLVPAVEAVAQPPVFVLVLSSGKILDFEDAMKEPWGNRLVVGMPADLAVGNDQVGKGLGPTLVPVDSRHPDESLLEILIGVISHRFRALGEETPEGLGAWLQERLGLPADDADIIWQRLMEWSKELDTPRLDDGDDPARRILCTLRWRAKTDIAECVERLRAWRAGPESELAFQVAGAAARMLFKMIGLGGWHPPVESHGCLFELADTLIGADEGWNGAEGVLLAAHTLIEDEGWRAFLFGRPDGLLLPWLRRLAPNYHEELEGLARDWAARKGEEEVPQAISIVAEEILRIARFGDSGTLPTLTPEGSYRILVFDADDDSPTQLRRGAQLAAEVFNKSRTGGVSDCPPWVIFRLGWKAPLKEFTAKVTPNDLLSAGHRRPRLLHPLLDTLPLDAVDLILVVATGPLIDESDLAGSVWLPKIHCYLTDERWRKGRLLAQTPQISQADGMSPILRYLAEVSEARSGIEAPST